MLKIKCNNCKNELTIVGGTTYMCKKCHYLDTYKTAKELKCKRCGHSEFMYPKLEFIKCPKCGKEGTYEELDFIQYD